MKKYKNLLFDMDGTLIDSQEGIINAARYALKYYEITDEPIEKLNKFIGPPLQESFSNLYGFNKEKTEEAVKIYRQYYKTKGVFENSLYDGIPELLEELTKAGKKIILATSKAEIYAKQILENKGIDKYFSFVCGATIDGSRGKKAEVIKYILETNNFSIEDTVMIGDKSHDVIGAKQTSLDSIGVLYGYGDYEELSNAGATYIIKDVEELKEKLLK